MAKRVDLIERSIYKRTQSFYAVSSWVEISYLLGPWIAGIAVAVLLPVFCQFNAYVLYVFTIAGIYALLAISWTLLALLRLYSLGHAMYIGISGYIIGILSVSVWNLPFYACAVLAIFGGLLLLVSFHAASLKVKGPYFLLATLLLPIMLAEATYLAPGILRAEEGISGIPVPSYGLVPPSIANYYLVTVFVILILIFARRFINSKEIGLIVRCIADNEYAVEASGLSVWRYKILIFAVSSAIGVIAGILYTLVRGYIGPSSLSLTVSLTPLLGSVIGTVSTNIAGAVIGTYLLVVLLEGLRIAAIYKIIVYAVIIVIVVLTRPRGLFHYMEQFYHFFRRVYE